MKFTIRDLFLVTVIVALAAGWWVDRSAMQRRLRVYRFNAETHSEFIYERGEPNFSAPAPNPPKP